MKGAVQVSIGFIIIMVISALVLIFALSWLGGMWNQMKQIGTYMTGQAIKQMTDSLRQGNDVILTTFPYSSEGVTIPVGSTTAFKVGVKKTAGAVIGSQEVDFFAICVSNLNDATCQSPTGTQMGVDLSGIKLTFPSMLTIKQRGQIQMVDSDMTIPGTYDPVASGDIRGFRVFVCSASTSAGRCTGLGDPNLYGYTDFIIHIE